MWSVGEIAECFGLKKKVMKLTVVITGLGIVLRPLGRRFTHALKMAFLE
jgi:hypothetical protein